MIKWLIDILFGWVPYVPKAIWGMLTIKHKGSWPHALRALGFFSLPILLIFYGLVVKIDSDDFSVDYPSYNELNIDTGALKFVKYAKRQFDLGLIKSDGNNIHIQRQYHYFTGIDTWYKDQNNNFNRKLAYPVTIRWFPLAHGSVWIAEIEREGEIVVSYSKGKEAFYALKQRNKEWCFYNFWLPLFIFIMIIIFESSAIRKYTN